jgi:Mrp family chromosome partitioning ATPase
MAFRNPARIGGGPAYLWMAARAKNALRRLAVFGGVGAAVFVIAIIAFVLVPKKASRRARIVASQIEAKLDSGPSAQLRRRSIATTISSDSALVAARGVKDTTTAVATDTLSPAMVARRDSLSAAAAHLNTLLQVVSEAPLPSSYRRLAQDPAVAGDPQIPLLLDSLSAIEKDRAAYENVGSADPGFAALSARASAIGRIITAVATDKRDRFRTELFALRPPPPVVAPTAFTDTMRFLNQKAEAMRAVASANAEIARIRAQNQHVDSQAEHARDLANLGAPPWAMLAAALVLAMALGFAGSLAFELQRPTIADSREAQQVAGERVLTVIRPVPPVVERGRRSVDISAPPLIDVISDAYRTLYLHIASVGAGLPIITVTGDEPEIVATVAANLAASAAYEARSALLVDVDASTCSVAGVLRVPPDPGLSAVLSGTASWAEAIRPTTIGRDRPLDVLPSGTKRTGMLEPHVTEHVKSELAALQRRYDFIIIAAPTSYVQRTETSIIPSDEILLTARIARTSLASLRTAADALRGVDRKIQGLVLWDSPFPQLESKEELVRLASAGVTP